jgi:hypoxanthine phosphoribosyltransferase
METVTEFISAEQIQARVKEIGAQITKDYQGKKLFMIGVLKGSFIFMADLVRAIDLPLDISFIAVSSYHASTQSSGEVRLLYDVDKPLQGKDVIIVEDIVDSGHTLAFLLNAFKARKADSIKICTLLSKPARRVNGLEADYTGFEIEDKFVVGYGLDYAGKYRSLPSVFSMDLGME